MSPWISSSFLGLYLGVCSLSISSHMLCTPIGLILKCNVTFQIPGASARGIDT